MTEPRKPRRTKPAAPAPEVEVEAPIVVSAEPEIFRDHEASDAAGADVYEVRAGDFVRGGLDWAGACALANQLRA